MRGIILAGGSGTRLYPLTMVVHHGHVTTGGHDFDRVRTYLVNGRTFVRRWGHRLPPAEIPEPALLGKEG